MGLFAGPPFSLLLGAHRVGVRGLASDVGGSVGVGVLVLFFLLEEIEGVLGAVLPDLVHEIFEGLHPELVDGGDEVHSWAFHLFGVGHHVREAVFEFLREGR